MAALTSCPRCDVSLFVPLALLTPEPHGRFRCPACQAEVDVPEAFAAVHKTVLEAIPIGEDGAVLTTPAVPLAPAAVDSTGTAEPAFFAFAPPGTAANQSDATVDDDEDASDDADESDDAPSPGFGSFRGGEEGESNLAARRRRSSGGGSLIRSMLGIVLGGVIGIGGGLLVLRAVQGDKFRSPIPLPKIPWVADLFKTADHPADDAPGEHPADARPEFTRGGPLTEMPVIPLPEGMETTPPDRRKRRPGLGEEETTGGSSRPVSTASVGTSERPAPPADEPRVRPLPAATSAAMPAATGESTAPVDFVKGAPKRSLGDVSQAMAAAAGKLLNAPPGETPIDDVVYDELSKVGETLAFLEGGDAKTVAPFRDGAGKLLTSAVFGRPNVDAAAAMGVKRVTGDSPSGTGVVLAGQILKMTPENGLWVFEVEPRNSNQTVTVLAAERFNVIAYERIVLAGAVVADPAVNVVGYKGNAERVVWAGYIGRLAPKALAPTPGAPKAPAATPKATPPASKTPATPAESEPETPAQAQGKPATPAPAPASPDKPAAPKEPAAEEAPAAPAAPTPSEANAPTNP
ncbi:MAG TPA: hypothetical protein VGE52_18690 [Pirellulales bacterium]